MHVKPIMDSCVKGSRVVLSTNDCHNDDWTCLPLMEL